MENKHLFLSALGVGVGVGLGFASSQTVSRWAGGGGAPLFGITLENMEIEMLRQIVDGRDSKVTFDHFPYYLSEQTRALLTNAAYVHLKHADVSRYTRNLAPASQAILLSGPAELYQQMLAKALAHFFDAKLLILDVTEFSLKMQSKYGGSREGMLKKSPSESTLEKFSGLLGSVPLLSQSGENRGARAFKSFSTTGQSKSMYGLPGSFRRQGSSTDLNIVSRGSEWSNRPTHRRNASVAGGMDKLASAQAPPRQIPSWCFDERLLVQAIHKVLTYVSKAHPIVLYIRDVDKLLSRSQRMYNMFQKMMERLSGSLLILGSEILDLGLEDKLDDDRLTALFPYNIEIRPPDDEKHLISWKTQLEKDMKLIQAQDNKNHVVEVLSANDLECHDLDSVCMADTMALSRNIEEIVMAAVSHHLMNTRDPDYRNGRLVISSGSLSHGLSLFMEGKSGSKFVSNQIDIPKELTGGMTVAVKPESRAEGTNAERKGEVAPVSTATKTDAANPPPPQKATEVAPDNEFEKRIRPEVIPANEINVSFSDIGALDDVKDNLQELVMLPLRRPDLFEGGLLKPCRGILLFGPPGTGKTMLAKAIAREAGASFINVSMSTITSKWFGEDEKNVRALFTLAAKVSPTIIFVDEVDSMLGQRSRAGEHEAMRKIKNEFMTHWDGLLSKPGERILVLAATNRPFDLDEAIIRRFERRVMVGLPSLENREKIITTLLAKEKVDEKISMKELAAMTEGYSGSDLKNLCVTAAYRPVRDLIKQERLKDMERKHRAAEGNNTETGMREERVINLRPLNMEDFKHARNQVGASYASEGASMNELKQWNNLYGEGGARKKEEHQLSYFL